ncbi:helix-turn-helix transcriptional regulator [Pseudacidovorax sp. NFM-22]|uniref:helix-turn-helix transcriptional regulator n=1 Tax=Pseudacidovorax sp. NFM-22 TaxID=2744469 RepID=UPI001F24A43C|nr:WYL domain-containing protein [Pseudacidovorax sp. NFM-22]
MTASMKKTGTALPAHDTIARRLAEILIKLSRGESVTPEGLAQEFNVHLRTIQRDLNSRLGALPWVKKDGRYSIDPAVLGRLTYTNVDRLVSLTGLQGMFPTLSKEFLNTLFASQDPPAWLVKGPHYQDPSGYGEVFSALQQAIAEGRLISFRMADRPSRVYDSVAPYRLINMKGVWYLAAVHNGKCKTFGLSKLEGVLRSDDRFDKDPQTEAWIQQLDGVWHSQEERSVMLAVSPEAAPYFHRRPLLPHQNITRQGEDGALEVTTTVGHPNQVLPVVRFWIPHIRIVSPPEWQADLERSLRSYLNGCMADAGTSSLGNSLAPYNEDSQPS